jgi:acyl dehydratase
MKAPATLYWEDIDTGRVLKTGLLDIDAPGIRGFAEKCDAAKASLFGGLCASGWHVSAMMMKLISEELIKENIALVGSRKVPWLEWYRPVFEGDTISATATIADKTEADGDADCGLIGFDIEVHNQNDKKVMALSAYLMVEKRDAAHV